MSKSTKTKPAKAVRVTFENLVGPIHAVHRESATQTSRAVNLSLTLRNWLIGAHIVEYEQSGQDRATYGARLLARRPTRLQSAGVSRAEERELRRYRQFYQTYPQIRESLTPEFKVLLPQPAPAAPHRTIRESATPESSTPGQEIVTKLSFTHIAELLNLEAPATRAFYEAECIRGVWSVLELKRQIAALYFERSVLSRDQRKLAASARRKTEKAPPALAIRDPYIFEFLGLTPQEVMGESDLEDSLLDHLQKLLLELGHGFCFEARKKRILIGDTHGFVDLVFYHRILKCHVLLDLKLEPFTHENIGQLNTYVTWYARHMMAAGARPPIGLLLCAQKDHALAGMDNRLFVSQYQLHLPKPAQLRRALERTLKTEAQP